MFVDSITLHMKIIHKINNIKQPELTAVNTYMHEIGFLFPIAIIMITVTAFSIKAIHIVSYILRGGGYTAHIYDLFCHFFSIIMWGGGVLYSCLIDFL